MFDFTDTCNEIQISGNDTNKSKLYAWWNWEQIKCGECLQPFGEEFLTYCLIFMNVKIT
jgi:hypothetical protein